MRVTLDLPDVRKLDEIGNGSAWIVEKFAIHFNASMAFRAKVGLSGCSVFDVEPADHLGQEQKSKTSLN